ncbi:MAG: SMI1/KNR4 family protein [Frankia sp.]
MIEEPLMVRGPVTVPEWRSFLRSYSADYLRVATEREVAELDDVQREKQWLGYEPATEEAVRAAEERLGVRLPPSYRNFLLASNGWRNIDVLLNDLLNVEEIGWFSALAPELYEIWSDDEESDEESEDWLRQCVLLSGPADGDCWYLDASVIQPDGEWTACEWSYSSGEQPIPYPSFGALVLRARKFFEELSGKQGRPVNSEGVDELLAQGRRHGLAGNVDASRAVFDRAHALGSTLAPYLFGLLTFFVEPGPMAESYIRNNVLYDRILESVDETHLRAELIPLYLDVWRDGANQSPGYLAGFVTDYLPPVDPAIDPASMTRFDVLASRARRYVPPVLPEAPAFQQALDRARELIAEGDNDAAWAVVEQALPWWESDSPFRIAPVILRTDPAFRPIITPDRYRAIVTTPRHGTAHTPEP